MYQEKLQTLCVKLLRAGKHVGIAYSGDSVFLLPKMEAAYELPMRDLEINPARCRNVQDDLDRFLARPLFYTTAAHPGNDDALTTIKKGHVLRPIVAADSAAPLVKTCVNEKYYQLFDPQAHYYLGTKTIDPVYVVEAGVRGLIFPDLTGTKAEEHAAATEYQSVAAVKGG